MISRSASETKRIAKKIMKRLMHHASKHAAVIALYGDLGSGKTTFVQGLAQGLGIKRHITSPTFLIIRRYPLARHKRFSNLYHLDLYQIQKSKELLDLGFKEITADPKNIIVIEWAEKIESFLPQPQTIRVDFEHTRKEQERVIRVR